MKVLVIGGGGREHALAAKLAASPLVDKVICAPGNKGMTEAEMAPVKAGDIQGLLDLAVKEKVDLTVVGPEDPLCRGIVDLFQEKGLKIFGPGRDGAVLEGSKVAAKEFMARHGIPTSGFVVFDDPAKAKLHLAVHPGPCVVKADGLAAGKGVFVCDNAEEAVQAVDTIMIDQAFGRAGEKILIEERLIGEEASFIVVTDGKSVLPFPSSQDHKAVFDGDKGPNTGGMGAYSPAPVMDQVMTQRVMDKVIAPTIAGLKAEGWDYHGFIYAGLMITPQGPMVLEYNCRLGDPEAQPLLMRLKSDLVEIIQAALEGRLDQVKPVWEDRASACVVMAAQGYPGSYEKGMIITGLEEARQTGAEIFHAGTAIENGQTVTAGGRVLGVCALGDGIAEAVAAAYKAVDRISWDGAYCRTDIGKKALSRPRVGIVMGSDSDWPTMKLCAEKLKALGINFEVRVMSAHRTPMEAGRYAREAASRGIKVLIAAAGGAAHLAGALAGHSTLPIIGIPLTATALNGMDALLATVQMPPGVPVATVGLDKWGAMNAAVLAAQIIALFDPRVAEKIAAEKEQMKVKVAKGNAKVAAEVESL